MHLSTLDRRVRTLCLAGIAFAMAATSASAADKAIYAQAGPFYPSFAESYGVTKYVETLKGLFQTHPALKDEIELQAFGAATLYPDQDAHVEALSTGEIQITYVSPHFLEALEPAFKVGNTPGLFDDFGHFERTMDSEPWQTVHDGLARKGVTVLDWSFDAGTIYLFTEEKVTSPADLGGQKVRYPGGEGWRLAIESLGANPIAMPYTEVVTALQTNMVSGVVTDFTGGADFFELPRYTPNAVLVPISIQPVGIAVNTGWWQGLTDEQRAAIAQVFEIMNTSQFYAGLSERKIAEWETNGKLTVVRPEEATAAEWVERMREGVDGLLADLDAPLVDAIAAHR